MSSSILIVDEDPALWEARSAVLARTLGCQVEIESHPTSAVETAQRVAANVVLARKWYRTDSGVRMLREIAEARPDAVQVVVVAPGTPAATLAPTLVETRAFAIIPADVDDEQLVGVVRDAIAHAEAMAAAQSVRTRWLTRSAELMHMDHTELAEGVATARSRADRDPLTGVGTSSAIVERLEYEVERQGRYRSPVAVVMLDIDDIDHVNDVHGFSAGDVVIQAVGAYLSRSVRQADSTGRVGGDAFLVLCPHTDLRAGRLVADRMRREISEMGIWCGGETVRVTVSAGVAAVAPNEVATTEQLLERVRDAVAAAKQAGKNRTSVQSDLPDLDGLI